MNRLIAVFFSVIASQDDYLLDDGFHPILSDFYRGKLYFAQTINNFAENIGSVCVGDGAYSLKAHRGKRFADAVCNKLGFKRAKFHGLREEYETGNRTRSIEPSKTCDFDFIANGAKCNGTELEQCHLREIAASGKRSCINGKSELFLECHYEGHYENEELTEIMTLGCEDGGDFATTLRMCGVPKEEDEGKRGLAPKHSSVKRCYGTLIERKCCEREPTANYNAEYYSYSDSNPYSSYESRYDKFVYDDVDPLKRGTTPNQVCECGNIAQWNRVHMDEVNSFSNVSPNREETIDTEQGGIAGQPSTSGTDEFLEEDSDFYSDEVGDSESPTDHSNEYGIQNPSTSQSSPNTNLENAKPSSAIKLAFGLQIALCLFLFYLL